MISVQSIEFAHLDEVGRFLHEKLNPRISAETWVGSLTHRWAETQPNYGMQLRDDDRLVGVFCAIYSDQWIDGKLEKFCNPHSWCVLDEYRNHGIGLVLRLLKQPGYHFTMFTPNPKVAKVFLGLKFRNLDERVAHFPNVPRFGLRREGEFLVSDPAAIASRLTGHAARDFNAHRAIPWLRFAAFGGAAGTCLVVYKTDRFKRMPCARIMHVSDPEVFERHSGLLRTHLSTSEGLLVSRIESRLLHSDPWLSYRTTRGQPKLVLSPVPDSKTTDLYSELVALDL